MAAFRALILVVALAGFFLIGAPLQWVLARYVPGLAHPIPLFFCRTLLRIIGVRVSTEGLRAGGGPVLMVANHVSWIDILALGTVTPFCFLAKREVASWPVLSAFAEVQGTVFVDRARRRTILAANRMMAQRMLGGRPVLLFPEGTTISAAEPGPFRSSHFAAARDFLAMAPAEAAQAVQVQPVAIAYSSKVAAWVGDEALVPHLWRVLKAAPLDCAVGFAAPIAFAPGADRKRIARQAREAVIEDLGRRLTGAVQGDSLSDDDRLHDDRLHGDGLDDDFGQPAVTGC